MKKRSFRAKMVYALLAFTVLLTTVICVTVGIYFKNEEMQQYSDIAYSYAKTAAEYIDGDKVISYVETGDKDEYYNQVMHFLNCTQAKTDILYYYVFVPQEDDLVYIWDADNIDGSCPLGYHEDYMEGGKEDSFASMSGNLKSMMKITDDKTYGYIGSVYYPIYNSAGESVALIGVDLSMPNINSNLLHFIGVIVLCVVFVIAICITALFLIINKAFINPISQLNHAAKNMASNIENEYDEKINIKTGDEIQELAESFTQMKVEIRDYICRLEKITVEKERIGAELNVATQIQASMLPCIFPAFPEKKEFDIYATMNPAKEVGGDFYDFFLVDEDHLAVVMADVSGKGVPAALFMVIAKTLIKDRVQAGLSPDEVFAKVNEQLCESNKEGLFVTAWLGVFEISTGHMVYANAGHNPPLVCKATGKYEYVRIRPGFVLAGMEGMKYKIGEIQFEHGDTLYLYTDGVTEATDANNNLYGEDRLKQTLDANKMKAPKDILAAVKKDIDEFAGEVPQFDDITMLGLQFGKSGELNESQQALCSYEPGGACH